jgi:hypothetical protein
MAITGMSRLRRNTTAGLFSAIPSAAAAAGTYYFATDSGHYYYSDGTTWTLKDPDVTEVDPSTETVLSCGVSSLGAIQPFKVTPDGFQRIAGVIGEAANYTGTIAEANVSQKVADAKVERKYLIVQNTSDTDMFVGIGFTPTTTSGILLPKNGGSLICDLFVPNQQINIICSVSGKGYCALEG